MTDTDTFRYPPSSRGAAIDKQQLCQKLKIEARYFQNPMVDIHLQKHINKLQPPPASIWEMIHTRGATGGCGGATLFGDAKPVATTTTVNPQSSYNNKNQLNLAAMIDEHLKILTTDRVQEKRQQQKEQLHQGPLIVDDHPMESLWDYLDSLDRRDNPDFDEHMASPVYLNCEEMSGCNRKAENQKSSPKKNGFLPTAFNSLRNLVGNVFRLPSLIMGTLTESNPASPQHYNHHMDSSSKLSGQCDEEHLFFDDIDFLPETSPPTTPSNTASDNDDPCQYEAFFLAEPHHYPSHDNNYNDNSFEKQRLQQKQNYETKDWLPVDCVAEPKCIVEEQERVAVPAATATTTTTTTTTVPPSSFTAEDSDVLGNNNQNSEIEPVEKPSPTVPEVPKSTKAALIGTKASALLPAVTPSIVKRSPTPAVDIVKVNDQSTVRRFISTPEQECHRMAVVRPRKRQTASIKTALVTRSTPIAMNKKNPSTSHCTRQCKPRILYPKRTTLDKNRKEKRRHEISHNIHEDFDLDSDCSEAMANAAPSDTEDDDLLPLTARNLIEPSSLLGFCGGESSMNSSTGSMGGRSTGGGFSVPRRNSINFQNKGAYEREFPLMPAAEKKTDNTGEVSLEEGELSDGVKVTKKKNGAVFFEIPNTPQKRILMTAKMTPMKQRTTSVMSSSVGSSFDSCGKFWGTCGSSNKAVGGGRRTRTVSEDDDDLIEFVREPGTDYMADVFDSEEEDEEDDDDDEDYSSEEDCTTEESETEEELTDDEDEDDEVVASEVIKKEGDSDLPDSGLEEKKVSSRGISLFTIHCHVLLLHSMRTLISA